MSQEFSRTENRILGALSRIDDFLMNPLFQGYSGTAPETSRNAFSTNQGTNEDNSQSDPYPEAGVFHSQTTRNSGPEDGHDNYLFGKCANDFFTGSPQLEMGSSGPRKAVRGQENFTCK